MDSVFKNIIIFISGFFLAILVYRSPSVVKNQISHFSDESSDFKTQNTNSPFLTSRMGLDSKTKSKSKSTYTITKSLFNSNSSGASMQYTPSYSPNAEEQIPTAPPIGRPEATDQETENAEAENKEKDNGKEGDKNIASQSAKELFPPKRNSSTDNSSGGEKSLSSVNALVGSVVTQIKPDGSGQIANRPSTANNGGIRGGGSSSGSDNIESDTLPNTFTASGFSTAKKLYSSGSLSETEYLQYLNLGLSSQDESLENLASSELVRMKTRNAFSLLSQYAAASPSRIETLNQAILASYRSVSDLNFLSLMISDESSVESQNWAIHTLDVVLNGSSMDFTNQQIKDALVKNIGPSLSKLPSTHPSFDQAQSISGDINRIFS
jgi:hypothetical protein